MAPLVVGFDLDMTLIDTRPGIAAVWDALAAETGVFIDSRDAVSRLGPPLDEELQRWFPPEQVTAMGDRFRALYPGLAVLPTTAFEGARAAIDAVHRLGGQVVVVTGKYEPNARLHLDHLGLEADALHGWLWGPAKAEALLKHGATIYVGDHLGDIAGARAAHALSVAVPTGPISADELRAAGADVVLDDLGAFPAWLDEHVLEQRMADLDAQLARLGKVTVAFSGGADSAFLLASAVRVLGPDNVVAATAVSGSLPGTELEAARAFAADLGVTHVTPATHELDRPGYAENAGDRCYFCKAELLEVVLPIAARYGHAHVATGTNADDAVAGFRPGIAAAAERGAVTPLLDAGLTKGQVRTASRRRGLPTWDKPAAACLSSRIAYGINITPARLARVERAEAALRDALSTAGIPVRDLRVRDLGDTARIEVDHDAVATVSAAGDVLDAVRTAGFDAVEVDPRGFRSGALNELLAEPERFR
ncbi:MAG: pyridinium-3,5-biscarboxylic acid mononucleotide sulfurtransferase [Actinomycetota bacterium]|nr:pyridinium-3,5-biscarboxylic acid mononucleotide sulfurtransferase [Actinomycetota bacterium]